MRAVARELRSRDSQRRSARSQAARAAPMPAQCWPGKDARSGFRDSWPDCASIASVGGTRQAGLEHFRAISAIGRSPKVGTLAACGIGSAPDVARLYWRPRRGNTTNLGIGLPNLSILDAYPRTIEPTASMLLVSQPIGRPDCRLLTQNQRRHTCATLPNFHGTAWPCVVRFVSGSSASSGTTHAEWRFVQGSAQTASRLVTKAISDGWVD
jgi:hypothetical protein